MKTKTTARVAFLSLVLALSACRGAQNLPSGAKDSSMEWEVGQSAESVTQVVQVGSRGRLTVDLKTTSLCANSAVKLVVETAGKTVFSETVKAFPFEKAMQVPKNAKVAVTTSIVKVNDTNCVWLGTVQCRARW